MTNWSDQDLARTSLDSFRLSPEIENRRVLRKLLKDACVNMFVPHAPATEMAGLYFVHAEGDYVLAPFIAADSGKAFQHLR